MIEMGLGHYPYPPETYANVFAQLTAIVHGDPPELPEERFSKTSRDFVTRCLHKMPDLRATYAELLVSVNHKCVVFWISFSGFVRRFILQSTRLFTSIFSLTTKPFPSS